MYFLPPGLSHLNPLDASVSHFIPPNLHKLSPHLTKIVKGCMLRGERGGCQTQTQNHEVRDDSQSNEVLSARDRNTAAPADCSNTFRRGCSIFCLTDGLRVQTPPDHQPGQSRQNRHADFARRRAMKE